MFCTQCGQRLENGANFCPKCGSRAARPAAPVQQQTEATLTARPTQTTNDGSLPEGITRDADGTLRWTYTDGKKTTKRYYMNEEKAAQLLDPPKPDSTARKVGLELLDIADAFGPGDSNYAELPSEMFGSGRATEVPFTFRLMHWIKDDRKHLNLRLYAEGSPWNICFNTPEQYEFVRAHIIRHCDPNVQIKGK